jgi:hypothetical protein
MKVRAKGYFHSENVSITVTSSTELNTHLHECKLLANSWFVCLFIISNWKRAQPGVKFFKFFIRLQIDHTYIHMHKHLSSSHEEVESVNQSFLPICECCCLETVSYVEMNRQYNIPDPSGKNLHVFRKASELIQECSQVLFFVELLHPTIVEGTLSQSPCLRIPCVSCMTVGAAMVKQAHAIT